jgi:hypothetical protein
LRTTVRTGTWASVVSRVGTLIDKRQPLTPKLHVRVNLHGTYARAPYSERHLYIPFSWRKRSTLPPQFLLKYGGISDLRPSKWSLHQRDSEGF